MRDEIARGKRAAVAALAVRLLLDHAAPEHARITQLLASAERTDAAGIRQVLDQSRSELGLAATIDGVLMPALRQVGAWWESGRCDVPQEHALTETARDWIARFTASQSVNTDDPPILLACGPRDMHTVGLEALAALLAEHQRGSRVLGARTSELTLMSATQSTNAAAVVVVSQLQIQRRAAVDVIRAVEATGTPVFYAGNAFAFPGERRNVPGTYLGGTLATATMMILDSLGVDTPHPQSPTRVA